MSDSPHTIATANALKAICPDYPDYRTPPCDKRLDANATNCPAHTHHLSRRIYVASSWRNLMQEAVVHTLEAADFEVYDFKNPPNGTGFHWREVSLPRDNDAADVAAYLKALDHPRAVEGFQSDFDAMQWADTFVLVLPCGRSAHLELGWAVGAGKRTAILLEDPCTPELMYKMVDYLAPSLFDLLGWLGVKD